MELKALADEIRGMGHAWRVLGGGIAVFSNLDKSKATDLEIVQMATMCENCMGTAPDNKIKKAVARSDDAKSFWRNIGPHVEHNDEDCDEKLNAAHAAEN